MAEGWIKLHRQLQQSDLWNEKPFSRGQAWVDILLTANHEDKNILFDGRFVLVERGSFITSEIKLMAKWGWSKSKVRLFLSQLEIQQMIVKKTDSKKTALSICNYCVYQDSETTERPLKDHRKTTERPLKDTNKNDKNVKNDKKNIYIACQHLSMTEEEYKKLIAEYGEDKVKLKLEYAENYKKLTNYKSLYLTLNNWLKADKDKPDKPQAQPQQKKNGFKNFTEREYDGKKLENSWVNASRKEVMK